MIRTGSHPERSLDILSGNARVGALRGLKKTGALQLAILRMSDWLGFFSVVETYQRAKHEWPREDGESNRQAGCRVGNREAMMDSSPG